MNSNQTVSNQNTGSNEDTGVLERTKVQEPSFYKVLLLNDDFTPMEFVIHVLLKFFNKTKEEVETIMLQVYQQEKGIAGTFNFETAETKVHLVNTYSEQNRHPLQTTMEKD